MPELFLIISSKLEGKEIILDAKRGQKEYWLPEGLIKGCGGALFESAVVLCQTKLPKKQIRIGLKTQLENQKILI